MTMRMKFELSGFSIDVGPDYRPPPIEYSIERNKNNQNNLHIHEHPLHSTAGRYPGVKVISVYS